jgi:hypothetical protein
VKSSKKLLVNLAVFSAAMLFALFLGEGLVRVSVPQQLVNRQKGLWRPDSTLGWSHQENVDVIVNTGDRPARFVTDGRGYRINAPGEYESPSRPDFRVLVIGDSFVEGLMVNGEETFPKLLERDLSEKGVSVEVVNGGVSAWTPRQYLHKAQEVWEVEHFDLGIVFLYVGNDLIKESEGALIVKSIGTRPGFGWPRSLRYGDIKTSFGYPLNHWLESRSHLYILLRERGRVIAARIGLTTYDVAEVFFVTQKNDGRWEGTADICADIERIFRRHDASVIFVLLPAFYQVHEEIFHEYQRIVSIPDGELDLGQPSREFAKRMQERTSSPYIDMLAPLRSEAVSGKRLFGHVDRHFTEEGHRVVADQLLPVVFEMLSAPIQPDDSP